MGLAPREVGKVPGNSHRLSKSFLPVKPASSREKRKHFSEKQLSAIQISLDRSGSVAKQSPQMTDGRRAELERMAAYARRVADVAGEVLAVFTEDIDLPPLVLPRGFDDWMATRHTMRQMAVKAEAELATFDSRPAEADRG